MINKINLIFYLTLNLSKSIKKQIFIYVISIFPYNKDFKANN